MIELAINHMRWDTLDRREGRWMRDRGKQKTEEVGMEETQVNKEEDKEGMRRLEIREVAINRGDIRIMHTRDMGMGEEVDMAMGMEEDGREEEEDGKEEEEEDSGDDSLEEDV